MKNKRFWEGLETQADCRFAVLLSFTGLISNFQFVDQRGSNGESLIFRAFFSKNLPSHSSL